MDDIYEPLERYKRELKELFRKNAEEAFAEIERKSKINIAANKKLCEELDIIRRKLNESKGRLSRLKALRVLLIIVSILAIASPFYYQKVFGAAGGQYAPLYVGIAVVVGIAMLVYVFTGLRNSIKNSKMIVDELHKEYKDKLNEAWKQMDPVNSLFSWDIPTKLIEKTVPNIHFDSFFNVGRLTELCDDFGYNGWLNRNASVLFAHSGDIKGNPFVIARMLHTRMGMKEYEGHKTIHWTTYVTDANGKRRPIRQTQVLTATVSKPCPVYEEKSFLMYGNEAAPNLSFSRKPEGLIEDGFFVNMRKRRKRKSLEKFSRNLTDDSDYTMMANQEFEVLFETKNRDNEVEYRLLYTALAQRNILALMRDEEDAYGDDFEVIKSKKINVVYPKHFEEFSIDTDPKMFMDYNFEKVKERFMAINENYFRSVYFAFAPLLSVPLYQQTRTRKQIYGADLYNKSSFWEWESLVNYKGEEFFAHPQSITRNILKVSPIKQISDNTQCLKVTAHGYSGTTCVDRVKVFGGDGRYHTVSVEWIRYDPISMDTPLEITEMPNVDKEVIREEAIRNYSVRSLRRKILHDLDKS